MEKDRRVKGFWKGPIWLNLLRILVEYHPEQVKSLRGRGILVKYLDERASLAEDTINRLMQRGASQERAEELAFGQLPKIGEDQL